MDEQVLDAVSFKSHYLEGPCMQGEHTFLCPSHVVTRAQLQPQRILQRTLQEI